MIFPLGGANVVYCDFTSKKGYTLSFAMISHGLWYTWFIMISPVGRGTHCHLLWSPAGCGTRHLSWFHQWEGVHIVICYDLPWVVVHVIYHDFTSGKGYTLSFVMISRGLWYTSFIMISPVGRGTHCHLLWSPAGCGTRNLSWFHQWEWVHIVICYDLPWVVVHVIYHDFTSGKWYTLPFVMILPVGSGTRCHLSWFYQ
jgi:hypothetical protein